MSSVASTPQRLRVVRDELALEPLGPRRDDDLLAGRRPRSGRSSAATPSGPRRERRSQLLAPGHLDAGRDERRRGRERLVELVDAVQQVAELEAPEHLLQLRAVRRREHDLRRVEVELEVAPHRRELLRGRACSACSRIDFERAGDSSSTCSITSSSEPYCAISWPAVLSPIPGTPGMLSEVSPFRPMKSGTCSGLIPSAQLDPLGRVDVDVGDAARGHHQRDVVAHELEGVAVGRDDGRLDPGLVGAVARAWRSRRRPPSPRTRGCGSRRPRRSAGSTGTARAAGPASACARSCRSRAARSGARAACPRRPRRPSAGSRRAA